MNAPERFAMWLATAEHRDRRYGHLYRYHPRSDVHSVILCTYVLDDLVERSAVLREQASRAEVAYGINIRYTWPTTQKVKTLDLAIGRPATPILLGQMVRVTKFAEVFLACEAKAVMTEHVKSQPRVYDELSSSHEIVHQGRPDAIAAGITVVNIAATFVSPLRQTTAEQLYISQHLQPQVTARMVTHLRGLPIREHVGQVGFDAYCSFVVECDNQTVARLWEGAPAPQPGDRDHYETFIKRLAHFYTERFSSNH
jgi:hypothetical protein